MGSEGGEVAGKVMASKNIDTYFSKVQDEIAASKGYVDEARERFLEIKQESLKNAPELTEALLQGEDYFEYELVKLRTGQEAKVKVYAITEGNLLSIMNKFPDISFTQLSFDLKNQDFFIELASMATKLKRKTIEDKFVIRSILVRNHQGRHTAIPAPLRLIPQWGMDLA